MVAGRATLFVDGKVVQALRVSGNLPIPSGIRLRFGPGMQGTDLGLFCDGAIDEVRMSKSVRYHGAFQPNQRYKPDADTLALYHFDEGPDSKIAHDGLGNHDGTMHNTGYIQRGEPVDLHNDHESALVVGTAAGEEWDGNQLNMKFCWCPAGSFKMGEPTTQVDVSLTHGFWISKYEVTRGEWRDVMGSEPWKGNGNTPLGLDYPASSLNWTGAVRFSETLTQRERAAGRLPSNWGY